MIRFFFTLFILFFSFHSTYWYENQGFENYSETQNGITFECKNQCFLILGNTSKSDSLEINWKFLWNGVLWYGFVNGNEIIPWIITEIQNNSLKNNLFHMRDQPFYSQISNDIISVVIFQWPLKSENMNLKIKKFTFWEKLNSYWNNFTNIEPLTPYTINLRYGVKIWSTSIVWIAYIVLIIFLWILFFTKKINTTNILIFWIILFLFISFRNLVTNFSITKQWLTDYSFQSVENKIFFDSWDYYSFIEQVRNTLDLDSQKWKKCFIYVDSFRDWPFVGRLETVYAKPCYLTNEKEKADYFIFYKKEIPQDFEWELLLEYSSSYLLKK